jgi:hypothetical protein
VHFMLLWASLSVGVAVALIYLALILMRYLRKRKEREELERCEDSTQMINRLKEAFSEGLVDLTTGEGSQFG